MIYSRFVSVKLKHQNVEIKISRVLLDLAVHPSTEPEDEVESALLLDVVIRESPPILQLLPSEDEPLLVGWDSLLVLDLSLHILDGITRLHLQGDGLPGQSFHKDLHLGY